MWAGHMEGWEVNKANKEMSSTWNVNTDDDDQDWVDIKENTASEGLERVRMTGRPSGDDTAVQQQFGKKWRTHIIIIIKLYCHIQRSKITW